MSAYGQFCPVAKAMELLDERWTMLVVRELLSGSTHFNDLRRGNPKMSPALLSKRLRTLERAGVVRRTVEDGRSSYTLTPCGEELGGVVEALGAWGVRWIGELGEEDLDPHLLMWDMRRTVPIDRWPRGRTVVAFEFDDVAARAGRWWLCVTGDEADVCDYDPGFEVTATVATGLRTLIEVWRGDRSWSQALTSGLVTISGPSPAAREVPAWLGQMNLAATVRPG
ncbi:winged helix-turn-helix transcriptional regulator [Rhodococcus maanshanensis]|uniref:DNA-binding transcriptional regulator, HxlR family n=1 Tax=Rhodococcus maanshanensis TaxID=183556 RepID=A0A1H7RIW8_9NOCA|nr:helix-turn-helix domain-containing protein [Rhodococcus maanshanensis]SEL60201.1 DNA-binding transcriptional regulator, HxlR family [Rhodococcus maanshanensis]